ncbi:MAG: hypothetical protein L0G25_08680, partial [Psychrobacter sp.]|nr:hypothetical protein [Psychrobacter sp.]
MDSLLALIIGAVIGGVVSFAGNYFLNVQRYKQDSVKQDSDHNHNLIKQESEHKYERQIFLRKKYEELAFRLIEFTNILKSLSSQLSQGVGEANVNSDEFSEKGAKIEIINVLYFPELTNDCEDFLSASRQILVAHDINNQDIDNFDS